MSEPNEKLQKKIEFLESNINSGKSTEELNKEFEVWYEEDYKKRKRDEYVKNLRKAVQEESNINIKYIQDNYDSTNFCIYGNFQLNRVCTLEALVNVLCLKKVENGGFKSYKILYDGSGKSVYINHDGEAELPDNWETVKDSLLYLKGNYTDVMNNYTLIVTFRKCK